MKDTYCHKYYSMHAKWLRGSQVSAGLDTAVKSC